MLDCLFVPEQVFRKVVKMQYVLTGSEMSDCDARTSRVIGIPSLVLMERAALSVADGADEYLKKNNKKHGSVLIVAGRGNNGADGLAAGRILLDRGYTVYFLRLAGTISPGSSFDVQKRILDHYGVQIGIFSPETAEEFFSADTAADFFSAETTAGSFSAETSVNRDPQDQGGLFGKRPLVPDLIIDGLFGTGLSRELRGDAAAAVRFINQCRETYGTYVIAVDIPSGISSDDGSLMGCAVSCDETRTFAFLKRGHLMYPGASFTGNCHLSQIGITSLSFGKTPGMFTMSEEKTEDLLPCRDPGGNKGTFGKVLIMAGQKNVCGAALLAAGACLASGAGMVTIFTHEANRLIIQQQLPEAMLETWSEADSPEDTASKLCSSLDWADIAAAGPGMGTGVMAEKILQTLLEYGQKALDGMVLDADALRLLAKNPSLRELLASRRSGLPCILTPHLAEFAALAGLSVGECAEDRSRIVQTTADNLRCTIACKDARTLVAAPCTERQEADSPIQYINCSGNSGMATAGSGDVLTGMTAAYLAGFIAEKACGSKTGNTASDGIRRMQYPGPSKEDIFSAAMRKEGFDAAVCAVYLHGKAGDLAAGLYGERGMTAGDLVEALRSPRLYES